MVVVSHLFFFFQINSGRVWLVVSHTLPALELSISRQPLFFVILLIFSFSHIIQNEKKEALYGIQYRTQKQNHRKNSQNEASSVRQKGDSPGSHGFVNRNAGLGRAGRSRYRYYLKLQPLQLWSYGRRYPVCSWESSCLSCRWDTGNVRNRVWHQRLVWFYSRRVHSNADGYDREN